ncbi:MAG: hypothetical protein KGL39_19810 [Patescibacteria group bacterium]|nr:hypothetical protein [Patescibacteria group bacterium]
MGEEEAVKILAAKNLHKGIFRWKREGERYITGGMEKKMYWLMNRAVASFWFALQYREGYLKMEQVYADPYLPSQIASVDLIGVTREV